MMRPKTNLDSAKFFLNLVGLRILEDEFNIDDVINIIDHNGHKVGNIRMFRDLILIDTNSEYGHIRANYRYVSFDELYRLSKHDFNNWIDTIEFTFNDKKIEGKYFVQSRFYDDSINTSFSCFLNFHSSKHTLVTLGFNETDNVFSFESVNRGGTEDFMLTHDGKLVYSNAYGVFDEHTKTFPFLTTVSIDKFFDTDLRIKSCVEITDNGLSIYKKERIYDYEDSLSYLISILEDTNPDIINRIEFFRTILGDTLFFNFVSSCLYEYDHNDLSRLFAFNDDSSNVKLSFKAMKKSS